MHVTTSKVRFLIPALLVGLLAACSDGSMSKRPGPEPALSAPKISSFKVKSASDANDIAGDSAEIAAGGDVVLTWDVAGAKDFEIATLSDGKKLDLSGSTESKTYTVRGLTADETFELTAFGDNAVLSQQRVTVKVKKTEIKILSFASKPDKINAGETAKLCWTISDAAATVTVKSGDTQYFPANTVPAEQPPADAGTPTIPADGYGTTSTPMQPSILKAQSLLLLTKADVAPAIPADSYGTTATTDSPKEVCGFTDSPSQTTIYKLTAVDGTTTVSQEYKLEVVVAPVQLTINSFTANPTQLSGPGQVLLQWDVTPADAEVDIDNGVATKQSASGTATASVSETTAFILTATTKDGRSKSQPVTITVNRPVVSGRVNLEVLTPAVFAGESAKFTVTTDNPTDTLSLKANGLEMVYSLSGSTLTVAKPITGSYTVTVGGMISNAQRVTVRDGLNYPRVTGGLNGLGLNGFGVLLVGNSSSSSNGLGMSRMLGLDDPKSTTLTFGSDGAYGNKYEKLTKFHIEHLDRFAPYTVQSIVFDSKTGRAYAGVTGAVLYSDNKGVSWDFVDVIPMLDMSKTFKDSAESHKGCGGVQRNGTTTLAAISMVNVADVCDLKVIYTADKKDRLLIATDFFGVVYIDGVDGRISDKNDATHAIQGFKKADNVLFGKAVSELVVTKSGDQTLILAAASDGVYLNSKNGDPKTWQALNAAGLKDKGSVNAIAVSGNEIFAGTDKGLFAYNGLDLNGQWTAVAGFAPAIAPAKPADPYTPASAVAAAPTGNAVKALAFDAADLSTLYIGTDKGLKLSRDCGATFVDVASDVGAVRNIATAAEGGQSAVALTSAKGLFVSKGDASTSGSCKVTAGTPAQPQTQTGTTAPGTVKPNS